MNLRQFKIGWYFDNNNCIRVDRMCPVLVEEGKCSKSTEICPRTSCQHKEPFCCVFAYTYILSQYRQ